MGFLNAVFGLSLVFASLPALAAPVDFDTCSFRLHKVGGLSLRDSQRECLRPTDASVLDCQNRNFMFAFRPAAEALDLCRLDPGTGRDLGGEYYRGRYEPLPSGARQTVCTLTVNSADEREAFRRFLDPAKYDHVELLSVAENGRFVPRDDHWLKRACNAGLRCDILVASGHFAEAFLGDSGFDVPLGDLTAASCGGGCRSFFESIREVYLFGCNTLAGRAPDHRSPSLYAKVLTEDGVPPHRAQRVSARRYTTYGRSIEEEMTSLFPRAKAIYGFTSVGPSGPSVAPFLARYLPQAYAEGAGDDVRTAAFRRELGAVGMVRRAGRASGPVCDSQDVLLDPSLKTRAGLAAYVEKYGGELPVPTVDLLTEGRRRGFLSETEFTDLRVALEKRWRGLGFVQRWTRLCPLSLTTHADWVPKDLHCAAIPAWLEGRE